MIAGGVGVAVVGGGDWMLPLLELEVVVAVVVAMVRAREPRVIIPKAETAGDRVLVFRLEGPGEATLLLNSLLSHPLPLPTLAPAGLLTKTPPALVIVVVVSQ